MSKRRGKIKDDKKRKDIKTLSKKHEKGRETKL
jgi:hypothetical protein